MNQWTFIKNQKSPIFMEKPEKIKWRDGFINPNHSELCPIWSNRLIRTEVSNQPA
jgi:hypothetical protein